MTEYCTHCGRPLPESGICPCRKRKPSARHRKSPLVTVLQNLPRLWRSYFRDPISTPRLAGERRDWITGTAMMLLIELLSLLGVVTLTLRYASSRFLTAAPQWLTAGLVCPLLSIGLMFGTIYALCSMARMRPDIPAMLAVIGVGSVLPVSALAVSLVLSLFHVSLFTVGTILAIAAWLISFFVMVYQVFNVRLNTASILLLLGALSASYGVVALCRNWLLSSLF